MEAAMKRKKRVPFGVVLENGRFVPYRVLKQYQTSGGSKQLRADAFAKKYARHGLIEPPYNPFALAGLSEKNVYLSLIHI